MCWSSSRLENQQSVLNLVIVVNEIPRCCLCISLKGSFFFSPVFFSFPFTNYFLQVHFNSPMNPLELEMYHQIKNVIGVNPSFYEYLFMVDADTTVDPMSVNCLISAYVYFFLLTFFTIYLTKMLGSMIHDKKLLGICGETELANAKQSLITMMQVSTRSFI